VILAHEVSKERKVLKEQMVNVVHKATLAHKVLREHKEQQVPLPIGVHKRNKVLEDSRVHKV
jgi:hypothetical protein